MNNPIVIGSFISGSHNYSDMRNNAGYGNDFGQPSDDIFYRFTVQGQTQITISTCGSGFDTYLHLVDGSGNYITHNDDYGPQCPAMQASISATLQAGTYYIIAEGYSNYSGIINFSVSLNVQGVAVHNTRNFVRTWDATAPETDPNALISKDLREVKQSTKYYDGLGRVEQTVVKKGSLSGSSNTDLVIPNEYDPFGREERRYLPYVAVTGDGLFKTTALTDQQSFNQTWFNSQGENSFFSKTNFESSPLNRVDKTMHPGSSWAGAGRGVSQKYWINTPADDVRIWDVSDVANSFATFSLSTFNSGIYPTGELYKNVTESENGKQIIEFKDKEGKVILKKVQLAANTEVNNNGSGHGGWLCTYYIYDDLGQLRCVLQPKAVEYLNQHNLWSNIPSGVIDELCFRYEYDAKGRMIMRKVPGAAPVYMVYDARDRLVMTQDGNMRTGVQKWLVTKYDDRNRLTETGLWHDPTAFTAHLSNAYASTSYPSTNSGWEQLTEMHYDDYMGLPNGVQYTLDATYINHFTTTYNAAPEYAQPLIQSLQISGQVAWTKTKVLGTPFQYIITVNIYDEKGRVIQTKSVNYTGGVDYVSTQYDFSGKVLRTHVRHQMYGGGTNQINQLATRNNYDDLGRVTSIEKNLNETGWKMISNLSYDALGQLKIKKVSPNYNSGVGLETINYDYNIRGWLLGTNRDYAKDVGNKNHYFGFDLGYDRQTLGAIGNYTTAQYNGNITGTVWKTAGDDQIRKYDFSYDAVNRLNAASFNQNTDGSNWSALALNFSVGGHNGIIEYDANGNIQHMKQMGWTVGGSATIDNLQYHYNANSNKLLAVSEITNGAADHKLGDFTDKNQSIDDYSYDANGNLALDKNKSISSLNYNHLNLPQTITVTGKGTIQYSYDASGNKLRKIATDNTVAGKTIVLTTTYLGGAVYESRQTTPSDPTNDYTDRLLFLPHEEGRIRYKPATGSVAASFEWDYFLKDHLGNVRMVLTEEEKIDPYQTLTFEDGNTVEQNAQWENKDGSSIDVLNVRTQAQVNWGGTQTYARIVRTSQPNSSIGAAKLLKVMAGDRIHTKVEYFYPNGAATTNTSQSPASTMLTSLAATINASSAATTLLHGQGSAITAPLGGNNELISFLNPSPATDPQHPNLQAPKAYLCVLFFDERFQFLKNESYLETVQYKTDGIGTIDKTFANAIAVPKNGYAYLYFTNESDELLYMDNFYLSHERGAILEETHYYPFGLTIASISSKASGSLPNKMKYNGKDDESGEFSDGSGLSVYDFGFRIHDPQIGRFWQIDPMGSEMPSTSHYSYAANNPILYMDYLGLFPDNSITTTYVDKDGRILDVVNDGKTDVVQFDDISYDQWDQQYNYQLPYKGNGKLIGHTIYWYDFMYLDEQNGKLAKPMRGVNIKNPLTFFWAHLFNVFQDDRKVKSNTFPSALALLSLLNEDWNAILDDYFLYASALSRLSDLSGNTMPYDIKHTLLGSNRGYIYAYDANNLPIFTTGRALGNILFGNNLSSIADMSWSSKRSIWGIAMAAVGAYNERNGAHMEDRSYYGEHPYSGSYIYYGYWGRTSSSYE